MAKGQDLICQRCQRRLGHPIASAAAVTYCDNCCDHKLARDSSKEMQARWACLDAEEPVWCKMYTGEISKRRAPILEIGVTYFCRGKSCCSNLGNQAWPRH